VTLKRGGRGGGGSGRRRGSPVACWGKKTAPRRKAFFPLRHVKKKLSPLGPDGAVRAPYPISVKGRPTVGLFGWPLLAGRGGGARSDVTGAGRRGGERPLRKHFHPPPARPAKVIRGQITV